MQPQKKGWNWSRDRVRPHSSAVNSSSHGFFGSLGSLAWLCFSLSDSAVCDERSGEAQDHELNASAKSHVERERERKMEYRRGERQTELIVLVFKG